MLLEAPVTLLDAPGMACGCTEGLVVTPLEVESEQSYGSLKLGVKVAKSQTPNIRIASINLIVTVLEAQMLDCIRKSLFR